MHLAAAVEPFPGVPRRAAVVIGGGREPIQFVQYPGQKVLSKVGTLPCCSRGGCWKYKQGDDCPHAIAFPDDDYAKCMADTSPTDVIDAINSYLVADGIR